VRLLTNKKLIFHTALFWIMTPCSLVGVLFPYFSFKQYIQLTEITKIYHWYWCSLRRKSTFHN